MLSDFGALGCESDVRSVCNKFYCLHNSSASHICLAGVVDVESCKPVDVWRSVDEGEWGGGVLIGGSGVT